MSKKNTWKIFMAIFLMLMLIFTFSDLSISNLMYNPDSSFGKFFKIWGPVPNMLFGSLATAVLVKTRNKDDKATDYTGLVIYGAAFITSSIAAVYVPLHYMGLKLFSLIHIISCIIYVILALFLINKIKIHNIQNFRRFAIICIIVFIATPLVVEVLKTIWGRVRYREMVEPYNMFTLWYIPQFKTFASLYTDAKSFPSGHTANSTVIFLLMLLPDLFPSLNNKRIMLFTISCIWVLLTALSRIIVGAHFATDVTFAVAIIIMLINGITYLVNKLFNYKGKTSLLP